VCDLLALFAVILLLRTAVFMRRRRLQFCAQQELVVLCFAYFGIVLWSILDCFSALNLMMRSSPARSRKKIHHCGLLTGTAALRRRSVEFGNRENLWTKARTKILYDIIIIARNDHKIIR
jgi:hypothetical protein